MLVMASLFSFAAVGALEHEVDSHHFARVARAAHVPHNYQVSTDSPPKTTASDEPISILYKNVQMLWMGVGSVIGGFCVCGIFQLKTIQDAARYFGVAVGASIGCSAFIVHHIGIVNPNQPHDCLFVGWMTAILAWAVFRLAEALFLFVYKEVQRDGIVGLKNAIVAIMSLGMAVRKNDPPKA